ncbi:MAG: hypothetical protein ACQEXJ_11810 [Myxococcota bacterium]
MVRTLLSKAITGLLASLWIVGCETVGNEESVFGPAGPDGPAIDREVSDGAMPWDPSDAPVDRFGDGWHAPGDGRGPKTEHDGGPGLGNREGEFADAGPEVCEIGAKLPLEPSCVCEPPARLWSEVELPPIEQLPGAHPETGVPTYMVCDHHLQAGFFDAIRWTWRGAEIPELPSGHGELMSAHYDEEAREFWLDHTLGPFSFRAGRPGVALRFMPERLAVFVLTPHEARLMAFDHEDGRLRYEWTFYPCPPCTHPDD